MTESTDFTRNCFVWLDATFLHGLVVNLDNQILPALPNLTQAPEIGSLEDVEAHLKVAIW